MVGLSLPTLSADLSTQLPLDSCKLPVSKHWSPAGDMRTLLSDFLEAHAPAQRGSERDTDAVSESSTTEDTSESDMCGGLQGAGEAQSLFGSFFNAASLEEGGEPGSAPWAGRMAVAVRPSAIVEKREKKEVDAWTAEEDLLILRLVDINGKRWSKIAESLPGRSDNGVRNRWNRIERAHTLRQAKGTDAGGYRCRRCGLPKRGHTCAALTQGVRAEDLAARNVELARISSQLQLGAGTPPLKLGKGVVKKPPCGQPGRQSGKAKRLKAAGTAVIALDRMDSIKHHPAAPQARQPYYDAASQAHGGCIQHGITFDECRMAARRLSPTIPNRPRLDRHTGLSGNLAQVDLGPISLGPHASNCLVTELGPLSAVPSARAPAPGSSVGYHGEDGFPQGVPDVSVDLSVHDPDASLDMTEANFDDFLMELHQSIIAPPLSPPACTPRAHAGTGPAAGRHFRHIVPLPPADPVFAGPVIGASHHEAVSSYTHAYAPAPVGRMASEDFPAAEDAYFASSMLWADAQ